MSSEHDNGELDVPQSAKEAPQYPNREKSTTRAIYWIGGTVILLLILMMHEQKMASLSGYERCEASWFDNVQQCRANVAVRRLRGY